MILDAYPLIAHLLDESPPSSELLAADDLCRMVAVNISECFDVLARVNGVSYDDIAAAVDLLEMDGLGVIPADEGLARLAGRLRAQHYRKGDAELSLADCYALAAAVTLSEPLVTCDPPLAKAARAEGVAVIGVPDSKGRTP